MKELISVVLTALVTAALTLVLVMSLVGRSDEPEQGYTDLDILEQYCVGYVDGFVTAVDGIIGRTPPQGWILATTMECINTEDENWRPTP